MKGIDSAIKKAAAELNIPEDQAKVVVMEYWNAIYKILIGGKNSAVTVRNVGTFAVSRYKLYITIRKLIIQIRKIRINPDYDEEKRQKKLQYFYEKLKLALKHRNDIAIQYALNFGNI